MAEYIDREALLKEIRDYAHRHLTEREQIGGVIPIAKIECAPAADVVPVVYGRWLCGQTVAWHTRYSCSVCGRSIEICVEDKKDGLHQYPYCHCGAKMDGN